MNFKIPFLIINSILCTCFYGVVSTPGTSYEKRLENKSRAEVKVEQLDSILEKAIPSSTSRTCIRQHLIDAYAKQYTAEDDARKWKDDTQEWKEKYHTTKIEHQPLELDLVTCKANMTILNNEMKSLNKEMKSLNTTWEAKMKSLNTTWEAKMDILRSELKNNQNSLRKLSVRVWLEYVEYHVFPAWLRNSPTMDRYEKWLFAAKFLKTENMNRIRKIWMSEYNGKGSNYENLAAGMYSIYERISDRTAHNAEDERPTNEEEVREICELVGKGSPYKKLACKSLAEVELVFEDSGKKNTKTGTHSILYGQIYSCGEINLAKERFTQLFSTDAGPTQNDIHSCEVEYDLLGTSENMSVKKQADKKKNR